MSNIEVVKSKTGVILSKIALSLHYRRTLNKVYHV